MLNQDLSSLLPVTLRPIGWKDINAVSASTLHCQFGLDKSQWARWYRTNIEENEFATKGEDWEVFDTMSKTSIGGRPSRDFFLALPFAKKLSMPVIAC